MGVYKYDESYIDKKYNYLTITGFGYNDFKNAVLNVSVIVELKNCSLQQMLLLEELKAVVVCTVSFLEKHQ